MKIYNSLISSHLSYGLLVWGNKSDKIYKFQKKAIRIINLGKYNAHTEPLFKKQYIKINGYLQITTAKILLY